MVKVFSQADSVFTSNGDVVLRPLKASVHNEDNGDYYLELEAGIEYAEFLTGGKIIVATTPQGEQAFRISTPEKTRKKISVKAHHIYYDSNNYLIEDSSVVEMNCNAALNHLNSATSDTSPFTTVSDVATIESCRCVRTSLNEAIGVVLERWGGHLVRDNWSIGIRASIGSDNGITIRYGKNIKEITYTENWDSVVTKLLPTGKDGIMLNALDSSVDVYLYSSTVYAIPYTKTVQFEQDINEEDYQDADGNTDETAYKTALIADLRTQATQYLTSHCIPELNYTLNATLNNTVNLGDTIEVIDERLGINVTTHVIAYDYDCILGKYTTIEFGNYKEKQLSNLVNNITQNAVEQAAEYTDNSISGMLDNMKNGYVIYNGKSLYVVDTLPKENALYCIRLNSYGIAFSSTGFDGNYKTVWSISNALNFANIDTITNLTLSLIHGGTLSLGAANNAYGQINVYDASNNVIGTIDNNGISVTQIRSAITAAMNTEIQMPQTGTYNIVPLNLDDSSGSDYTLRVDGGIAINKTSTILVSGRVTFGVAGSKFVKIGTTANVFAEARQTLSGAGCVVISPVLVNVTAGDVVYLYYKTDDANEIIIGSVYGRDTSLTVEVV